MMVSCQDEILTEQMGYSLTVEPVISRDTTVDFLIQVQVIAGDRDVIFTSFENTTTEWRNWLVIKSDYIIDSLAVHGNIVPSKGDIIDITEPGDVAPRFLLPANKIDTLSFRINTLGDPLPGSWAQVGLKSLLYQEAGEDRIKRINLWDLGAFQAPRVTY